MYALPHWTLYGQRRRGISLLWVFSHGTSSRVCLYQPYNQCRLVLRAWHPPRSRSGYIVSISTGPTRRQSRDNAAARSIVIEGEEACSVSAGRPAVLVNPERTWLAGSTCLFDTPFQMLICVPISTARPDGI